MEKENKYICPECGKIHNDEFDLVTELAEKTSLKFTEEAFPYVWKEAKKELKEMSKKELAKEMFCEGAFQMMLSFTDTMDEAFNMPKKLKEKENKE